MCFGWITPSTIQQRVIDIAMRGPANPIPKSPDNTRPAENRPAKPIRLPKFRTRSVQTEEDKAMRRGSRFLLLSVIGLLAYVLAPPRPFPDRLAPIDERDTTIDNAFYSLPQFATQWWNDDKKGLAGLQLLNPARVGYFHRVFAEKLGEAALTTTARFLDVGCGGGLATEALASRGLHITGIDISEASLESARRHAAEAGVDTVQYRTGSAYEIPFPDASFDGVVISDVLEHLHDVPRAVREMKRVLRPGGVLVFDTLTRTWPSYLVNTLIQEVLGWTPPGTHDWRLFITPEEMQQAFEAENFTVRE